MGLVWTNDVDTERKYLTYFSRVTDRRSDRLLGYMVDMTIGGTVGECTL
jgi:hypothetical protein